MLAETLVKQEPEEEMTNSELQGSSGAMVLNATSEFCRTLGEIPTYGVPGSKTEEEDELLVCVFMLKFLTLLAHVSAHTHAHTHTHTHTHRADVAR